MITGTIFIGILVVFHEIVVFDGKSTSVASSKVNVRSYLQAIGFKYYNMATKSYNLIFISKVYVASLYAVQVASSTFSEK